MVGELNISDPACSVYNDICGALRMRRGGGKMAVAPGDRSGCLIACRPVTGPVAYLSLGLKFVTVPGLHVNENWPQKE